MRARKSLALACVGLALAGCGVPGATRAHPLITGKVDTKAVFDADPDYPALSKQYISERVAMSQEYVKATTGKNPAAISQLQAKYGGRQKEMDKKWMDKTNNFVKGRRSKLEEAAGAICKDKGIDLVLIDVPGFRSVEFGGIDITQDLMSKLYGPKPVPTGTATPPADSGQK